MGERSGLGLVEVAILEALDAAGARPGRRHAKSARVLAALDERIGLAPGYAYQVLTDLALPWKVPVPLVDPRGNFGSRAVDLRLDARVTISDEAHLSAQVPQDVAGHFLRAERNRTLLVIDNFPPSVSPFEAARAIADRARERRWAPGHPGLHRTIRLPVMDVRDLSARGDYRIACLPEEGASPEDLQRQLMEIEGVTTRIPAALPQPLGAMIRGWVRACQDEDLPGSLAALENAIASGQPYDGR